MKAKRPKRMFCAVLALLLAALWSFCAAAGSAGADSGALFSAQDEADAPLLLLLGDSIASGYGIRNAYEAGYGRIVANTNHYRYENWAWAGCDSDDLNRLLDAEYITETVAAADIICMSIGANDYFNQSDTVDMLVGSLFGVNGKTLDALADRYYENLCSIMDLIASINPDTVIIVQTVYQAWRGIAGIANRAMSDRVNGMIERYDREHPNRIHICDLRPVMDGKPENYADDCVHPSANGNIAIAGAVLQTLYDLGLGTQTTPVVVVPGRDWDFFTAYFGKGKGIILEVLAKLATGNGINILRLFKNTGPAYAV